MLEYRERSVTAMISIRNFIILVYLLANSVQSEEVITTPSTPVVTSTQEYANYGEPCTKISDCDASAYLSCNGSCQCALRDVMKFDDASSSCWVLPGEKCVYRAAEVGLSLMVEAAMGEERTTLRGDRVSFRCVSNSACEDGYCVCLSGYFATQNFTCEPQNLHGEPCKSDLECRFADHLICNETSQCACHSDSSFDLNHGLCVGLSGSSCFDYEMCTANAFCPSFGIFNQYDVKCTCEPKFFEGVNRTCEAKRGYGDKCNNSLECRDDLNLVCIQNKCTCNTTSLYDTLESKCLSLVGSSCSENLPCVVNADCTHAGFLNGNVLARNMLCRCGHGFFENDEKICEKKREYDVECKDDIYCRDDLKLICNRATGFCSCNEGHTYDRSKRRCIALAGTLCERNQDCVMSSVCISPGFLYPRHNPKAECICKDGFTRSKDGYCLGKFGSKCESWTDSCMDGLSCRAGECSCKYGSLQQYYDYTTEECSTYVGASCQGSNDTSCVLNAFCQVAGETGPVCRCKEGFVSSDGRCAALVGQKCSEGEHGYYVPCTSYARCNEGFCRCAIDYYTTANGTCDRRKTYGEMCNSSIQCQDSYCEIMGGYCACNKKTSLFDATRKKCLRLAGAKCFEMRDCVKNSECHSPGRLNPVDKDATCHCADGYYISANGSCELKRNYGDKCTESSQCQDATDLICSVSGKCECNMTVSVFDETRLTCLRKAGSGCSGDKQCIGHSKCKNPLYWIHYETFSPNAKCVCEENLGYSNGSDGRCVIDYYGGKCDIGVQEMCSNKFSCQDGHCLCPYEDHQRYDPVTKTCRGLIKGPCDNTSTNACVKNALCITTEEGFSECRCKHGFIAVNRGCELTFGQACSTRSTKIAKRSGRLYISDGVGSEGTAETEEEPQCDRIAPLKCVHGTCSCSNFQFYDFELHSCRGLVGSICDPNKKGFCAEGSICEAYRSLPPGSTELVASSLNVTGTKKRYGRCQCMKNYTTDTNRTCSRSIK